MEGIVNEEVRALLESVWAKAQMLYAPIDAAAGELMEEESDGAYALGFGLQALFRSLWRDCGRLNELFAFRESAVCWAGSLGVHQMHAGSSTDPLPATDERDDHRSRERTKTE